MRVLRIPTQPGSVTTVQVPPGYFIQLIQERRDDQAHCEVSFPGMEANEFLDLYVGDVMPIPHDFSYGSISAVEQFMTDPRSGRAPEVRQIRIRIRYGIDDQVRVCLGIGELPSGIDMIRSPFRSGGHIEQRFDLPSQVAILETTHDGTEIAARVPCKGMRSGVLALTATAHPYFVSVAEVFAEPPAGGLVVNDQIAHYPIPLYVCPDDTSLAGTEHRTVLLPFPCTGKGDFLVVKYFYNGVLGAQPTVPANYLILSARDHQPQERAWVQGSDFLTAGAVSDDIILSVANMGHGAHYTATIRAYNNGANAYDVQIVLFANGATNTRRDSTVNTTSAVTPVAAGTSVAVSSSARFDCAVVRIDSAAIAQGRISLALRD